MVFSPNPNAQSWQLDSSGELVSYPDPFKEVDQEFATTAAAAEELVVQCKVAIEQNFLLLSAYLDEFDRRRYYLGRGYESMRDWCQSPEVEISWRLAQDLIRIRREVVPLLQKVHGAEFESTMLSAGVSKIRAALPLLNDGKSDNFVELVDQAREMPWNDVRAEVKRIRGVEVPMDQPSPVIFKAEITKYDDHVTIAIIGFDGVRSERLGKLRMRPEWLPRFEDRFGKYVNFNASDAP